MLKHSSSRVKNILAILLGVLFVLSLTAAAASAFDGLENDGLYELGLASAHGGSGFGGGGHGGHGAHGGYGDHGFGYGTQGIGHVNYGSYGSIGSYGANCGVVDGALVCSSY
jgi:hypothetical protein